MCCKRFVHDLRNMIDVEKHLRSLNNRGGYVRILNQDPLNNYVGVFDNIFTFNKSEYYIAKKQHCLQIVLRKYINSNKYVCDFFAGTFVKYMHTHDKYNNTLNYYFNLRNSHVLVEQHLN